MEKVRGTKYQIFMNLIWSVIAMGLSYGINFFMTPYVSEKLGVEAYGFISLANTLVTYIDIIAVAINAFSARYIGIAYHNGNYKEAEKFYNSVFVANLFLVILACIPCSFMIVRLEKIIAIPGYLTDDVKVLFALVLLNYSINLLATVFSVCAFIKNYTSITSRNNGIAKCIYGITLFGMIYFTHIHVYYMAVANCLATLVTLVMNLYYSKKLIPKLHLDIRTFSFKNVRALIASGIWNSINNIGNMLNTGLDLLITNQFLSSITMGQISIAKQLANLVTALSFQISNAFQPKQLEAYAKGDKNELIKYLTFSMKCMGIVGGTIVAGFIALGKQFYATWIPGQDTELLYKLTVIVMLGDVLVIVVRPLYYINTLTDKLKCVCWITIISGLFNVIGMIVLIKIFGMGAYAIVLTTMVINSINAFFVTPFLEAYFLELKDKYIFFRIVMRHVLTTLICTVALLLINTLLSNKAKWLIVLLNILILGSIGVFIMGIGECTKEERGYLVNMIKDKLTRKK